MNIEPASFDRLNEKKIIATPTEKLKDTVKEENEDNLNEGDVSKLEIKSNFKEKTHHLTKLDTRQTIEKTLNTKTIKNEISSKITKIGIYC